MSVLNDPDRIGQQVLGRYRIVRRLAQGGMGVVYLGRLEGAAGFSKPVVIKRIIADADEQQESTARFIREAQILSNLQHPNIVGVLDFGEEDERYSMVLEYVHGYDLGRWLKYLQLKAHTMHWEEAVLIILRVLDALSYAHGFRRSDGSSAEVLHRDISPGNVLMDVDGRVRLVDFGIARMEAGTGDLYKTQTGVLKGKLAFLAPELFGGSPPSPASDLYACAVILYQMLAGSNPFTANNESRVMWRVIMEGPGPLARERDDLPPGLEEVLFMSLDRDPARRHRSAEHLAEELRLLLLRTEAEIAAALRDHVRGDFNGDMPALLRLETLAERDRAWRQDSPSGAGLSREAVLAEAAATPSSSTPHTLSREWAPRPADSLTVRATGPATPRHSHVVTVPALPRRSSRSPSWKPLLGIGLGMSVVSGLIMAGALLYVRQPPPHPPEGRFIVVEATGASPSAAARQSARAPEQAPADAAHRVQRAAAEARAGETAGAPAAGGRDVSRATTPSRADDPGAALTRAFERRQLELAGCFDRHARDVEGRPELSIQFEVAPSGAVSRADVLPPAIAATALGECLAKIARSTHFGPQKRTTRFTIPIRASARARR